MPFKQAFKEGAFSLVRLTVNAALRKRQYLIEGYGTGALTHLVPSWRLAAFIIPPPERLGVALDPETLPSGHHKLRETPNGQCTCRA